MTKPVMRNEVYDDIVSTKDEQREIAETMLVSPKKKHFAEILVSMPDVGEDTDFKRIQE